jgi:adenosylmethionine-8-amino-7-oxononanoate aminotransferase
VSDLRQTDLAHLVHPFSVLRTLPTEGPRIIERGEGILVWDAAGREFIDGLAGLWCVNVGHGRKEIADAVSEQMARLAYAPTFFGYSNRPAIELAERLAARAPRGLTRVLFTNGGSESNETNIKIARYYWKLNGRPGKIKVISRRSAFHGVSLGALSATGIPRFWTMFEPLVPGFAHIMPPYCYRCDLGKTYPECQVACAGELEETIRREGPDTVAAFIGEPVMGGGGVIVPPAEYWREIQAICRKYDVLLILDEVITAFGRTGRFFAAEHWGLEPDLVALAKGITSAYVPMGAVLVHERIYGDLERKGPADLPFLHGFTYGGHPVASAAALRNLEILERERLADNAAEVGAYLKSRLETLRALPVVGEVRGLGLMLAVELVRDRDSRAGDPELGNRVARYAYEAGLIVRSLVSGTIALAPPLILTRAQADEIVRILKGAIERAIAETPPAR